MKERKKNQSQTSEISKGIILEVDMGWAYQSELMYWRNTILWLSNG